jgi:hypothetical protein
MVLFAGPVFPEWYCDSLRPVAADELEFKRG